MSPSRFYLNSHTREETTVVVVTKTEEIYHAIVYLLESTRWLGSVIEVGLTRLLDLSRLKIWSLGKICSSLENSSKIFKVMASERSCKNSVLDKQEDHCFFIVVFSFSLKTVLKLSAAWEHNDTCSSPQGTYLQKVRVHQLWSPQPWRLAQLVFVQYGNRLSAGSLLKGKTRLCLGKFLVLDCWEIVNGSARKDHRWLGQAALHEGRLRSTRVLKRKGCVRSQFYLESGNLKSEWRKCQVL